MASLSALVTLVHGSCPAAVGQSRKGQSHHPCKQAGKQTVMAGGRRVFGRPIFNPVSRRCSCRGGQRRWRDARRSSTPARDSATSSSSAQVSLAPPALPLVSHPRFLTTLMASAGPAALVCAETLRQEGFTDRIVMCTMDRHPPYDRPKLSKVCTQTTQSPSRQQLIQSVLVR